MARVEHLAHRRLLGVVAVIAALGTATAAQAGPALEPVFSSDLVINGATTSSGGRLFLPVQPQRPGAEPEVVEIKGGKPVPFPNPRWNGWQPGMDGADRFVGVNAIRVGPTAPSGSSTAANPASARRRRRTG